MNKHNYSYRSPLSGDSGGIKIYIIAGEPSGDILASRLMKAIRQKQPNAEFFGTGGETMAAEGFQSLFNIKDLSVMGLTEVIPKLPVILQHRRAVMRHIEEVQPDVIVTVDSWGFVDSILSKLKKKRVSIPRVHYVAPQVWAWKKGRAKKAARLMNHLMTLLPYEPAYFEQHGLACTFVGHPVIENTNKLPTDIASLKKQYNIPEKARVLCVLPGSRHSEVSKLAPVFVKTVLRLKQNLPNLYLLIPSVEVLKEEINEYFENCGVSYQIVCGQQARYETFCMSEFAIAASGTVSLELTACGTSHLIAYTFNPITNLLADILVDSYANLINILAGKIIIPEFTSKKCKANLIAPVALEFLQNETQRNQQIIEAKNYLLKLKPENKLPSEKAAETVLQLINK